MPKLFIQIQQSDHGKTISKVFLFGRFEPNFKLPNQFLLAQKTFHKNQPKLS